MGRTENGFNYCVPMSSVNVRLTFFYMGLLYGVTSDNLIKKMKMKICIFSEIIILMWIKMI